MFHRQIFTSERHRLETIHPLSDYYFLSADPLGPGLWWLDARVGCGQVRISHVLISVFSLGGAVRGSRHRPRPSGSDVTMATTRDLWPWPLARPPGPAPALLPRDIQQVSSSLSELQHSRRSSSCPPERSSSLLGGTRLHALEEHGRRFSVITPPHSCPHSLLSLMMVKLQFVQISSRAVVFLCRRSGSSSSEVGGSQHESRYRRLGSSEQLLRNASLLLLKRHTRRGRSRPSILQGIQGGPGVSGLLSGLDGKLHPYHHQPATGPAGEPVYTEGDQ